jgi:alkyl hydroperoxide reductase subunit F
LYPKFEKGIARMLDATLKSQLKTYLERVTQPIEIVASSTTARSPANCTTCWWKSPACRTSLPSARTARRPSSFVLAESPGADISLRFAGIPMGHEFTSLVLALLQVGGHPRKPAPK